MPLPINVPAVSHLHNQNLAGAVLNGIDQAVGAPPDAVFDFAGKFLASGRPWVFGLRFDLRDDSKAIFLGEGLDFFDRGGLDINPKAFLVSSGP